MRMSNNLEATEDQPEVSVGVNLSDFLQLLLDNRHFLMQTHRLTIVVEQRPRSVSDFHHEYVLPSTL